MVQLLSHLAEKKKIIINNHIAKYTFSYIDRNNVDIVLRNLVNNAVKFTKVNGQIDIAAIEKGGELQIEVTYNGVGVSLEAQTKLFENNSNKSTYGTNNERGTGLGLSFFKEMVENNDGKIWVSSIENNGTNIFFRIPLKAVMMEVF